jgi:hypothetical protein
MAPQSLKIPVTDFRWSYLPGNNHVQIQGTVINGEGRPVQGVIIALVLYDQNGVPVAVGDTYVSPTYLVAGGEGSFSVMALTSSKRMTHARLISNAQTRASY